MNLNNNDQMRARPHIASDQSLTAGHLIGITLAARHRPPDDGLREIGTYVSALLILSTSMTQRRLCQRDASPRTVQDPPQDGAEAPIFVMDAPLSIDPHDGQATWVP
jgi:hypothetical protein